MAKKSSQSPGVVHARIGRESRAELDALCRAAGKSSNELVAVAVAELLEVVAYANEIEAGLGKKYEPEDFVSFLGVRWVQRLISAGLASEAVKSAWRSQLEVVQGMVDERDALQGERRAR